MKTKFSLAILFTLSLIVHWGLITNPLPQTHDSQNHLARFANYYVAIKEGQFPPRWAPDLNRGFGYPVFNFNYPLPNILAFPFIVVNVSVENTLVILLVSSVILSGWGMYYLLQDLFGDSLAVFAASLFYAFSPYAMNLIYVRGVIGESLAYALLPWLFWLIRRVSRTGALVTKAGFLLSGLGALFLLAHNVVVLLSLPFFVLYIAALYVANELSIKALLSPLFLAISLSMFFWLPALAEKQFVALDGVSLSKQYLDHFATLSQLLTSPLQFGFSIPGPVDSMSFRLGIVSVLCLLFGLLVVVKRRIASVLIIMYAVVVSGYIFLLLPVSSFIWDVLPLVHYVQFPWRLMLFWPLLACVGMTWVLRETNNRFMSLLVGVLILIEVYPGTVNWQNFSRTDDHWFSFPGTTTVLAENMPIWMNEYTNAHQLKETVFMEYDIGAEDVDLDITTIDERGSRLEYLVNAPESAYVLLQRAYFPGWRVWIDGVLVEDLAKTIHEEGLIAFYVPEGEHQITAAFTQYTPSRITGNTLSMLGFLGFGWYGMYLRRIRHA